jgi:hypothetical protein
LRVKRLVGVSPSGRVASFLGCNVLGVTNTGEARPTNVGAIGKVLQSIFGSAELLEESRVADARLEGGRSYGRSHDEREDATTKKTKEER